MLVALAVFGGAAVAAATGDAGSTAVRSADAFFGTVAVGAPLPAGADCGFAVQRTGVEARPANATANHTLVPPTAIEVDGASRAWNAANAARVDGQFSGTTDEILRWASCKWGVDEDLTRARAFVESRWKQSQLGDRVANPATCARIGQPAPCYTSYGILQVKGTVHEGTFPGSAASTAWNADYALAWQRACYDGAMPWLGARYAAGDLWGCTGAWYSGRWYDAGARRYLAEVERARQRRGWERGDW
ncbi:MAG: hypothetical protein AB7H93_24615 [Vicinamibacterales bacterium]